MTNALEITDYTDSEFVDSMRKRAVLFLNANFQPWTFMGNEPVVLALTALLCEAVNARERGQVQMSDWQPMETAPKDGTAIIAISQIGNVYKMTYDDGGWVARNVGRWLLPEEVAGWMPLPDPPKAQP